jgi:uncharacterized protein (UPF0218 family)
MKDLKIPKNQRSKFAKPLGKLISGNRKDTIKEVISFLKSEREFNEGVSYRIYCVGDIVTQDFLNNPFLREMIKVCVIDEKTQRKRIKIPFKEFFDNIIELKNPKGTISNDMWSKFREIIDENRRILVKIIEGEEDLLIIPLISGFSLSKNFKNIVFYGQPPITDSEPPIPEGLVMVEITKNIQNVVNQLISLMEKY